MERILAIVLLMTATLNVTAQAVVKDIPSIFQENPKQRLEAENNADDTDVNYRLPNNTVPVHYDVHLTTNVHTGDLNFTGLLKLTLNATEDTRTIVLNLRRSTINNATIQRADGTGATLQMTYTYEATREFLTFTPEDTTITMVKDSQWILTIHYNGILRSDANGFYVSTYLDENNQTRYLATTQFESTNARHAFPCYDEPAKRATFAITIVHDATYTAISNMPVKEQTTSNGRNTTIFHVTPSMSTYLVAFIISDFKWTEAVLNDLPQRVFTRPGTEGDQEFALVSGLLIEARLASYFGVPFALPKLDQVGVPDFNSGAMENWGLSTYREEYMMYNKEKSTVSSQTLIANIIAHEYTHQWFGNLVAIKWWTWLWLKEGFANIFSYRATDEAYPEWRVMQIFHINDYQRALSVDSSNNPRPMTHYVQTQFEITMSYGTITYSKAGCVLFMWQNALTDKIFKRGVHNYFETNKYSAAEEDDLYEAIRIAAKEENFVTPATIKDMMSTWTTQGGYPVLTVERFYNGSFTVSQETFFDNANLKHNKTWYVPFNYAVRTNSDFRDTKATHYLLNAPSIHINDKISNEDWLILNKQSTGYYRINYDERNWNLIIDGLIAMPYKIDPRNRAQLLDDAYHFSISYRMKQSILLKMMTYLKAEDQYAPWSTANSILTFFNKYLNGDNSYTDFKFYVSELVGNIYNRLGVNDIPGEHHLDKYLRSITINLACMAGIRRCLEETNNKLKGYINDNIEIEPNLQLQTYCNGLKQSGDTEFNFVFKELMTSEDPARRRVLTSSLGCSQTESQIHAFIKSSIGNEANNTLSVPERISLLSSVYSNGGEMGLLACIAFLDKNWQKYAELTGGLNGKNPLQSDIVDMSTWVTNRKQAVKLLALVTKVKDSPFVSQNLEEVVKSNIQMISTWLSRNRDPLMNWITTYCKGGSATISASIMSVVLALSVLLIRLV